MPLSPEQKLWMDRVTQLRKEQKAADAATSSALDRDAIKAMLKQHLVDSGRSRGEKETGATALEIETARQVAEAARAKREDTLASEVTERIELSANASYVSEEVVRIVEAGAALPATALTMPVRTDPAYPLLNLHATRPAQPAHADPAYNTGPPPHGKNNLAYKAANKAYIDWGTQNSAFNRAVQAYEKDAKARRQRTAAAPAKAAADARLAELKTHQPDMYGALQKEAVAKEEARTKAKYTDDIAALTDRHLTQIYILDEIDTEISGRIAAHDAAVAASSATEDDETRLDAIAAIIEAVGVKYEFTNLAHFISRHGAARRNPTTGATKRTKSDAVARIATGVGPDQVKNLPQPATTVDGTVGGTAVQIPEYPTVGDQTAPASSQHASAKAALFMLQEGAAQTALEEHLVGSDGKTAVKVMIGAEDVAGDKLVSYPEAGGLGDAYKLRDTSTEDPLGKRTAPDSGDVLPRTKIENLLADIEQTHRQTSAIVTSTPDAILGGHTPMTMFSQDATPAKTTYRDSAGEQVFDKATALKAKRANEAAAAKQSAEQVKTEVDARALDAQSAATLAQAEQAKAQAAFELAIPAPDAATHQALIDALAAQSREAATARAKATASAALAAEGVKAKPAVDDEVTRSKAALVAAETAAAEPESKPGTAKTADEKARDARAVEEIGAWAGRALARQTALDDIVKTAAATKLADETAAADLEAALDAAVKKAGLPLPPASLEKVVALAQAELKAATAREDAARWAKAAAGAQARVDQAEEAVQLAADEQKVLGDELLAARLAKTTAANDLAKAGGPAARDALAKLEAAELQEIDTGDAVAGKSAKALAADATKDREGVQKSAEAKQAAADLAAEQLAQTKATAAAAKRQRTEGLAAAAEGAEQQRLAVAGLETRKHEAAEDVRQKHELEQRGAERLAALEAGPGMEVGAGLDAAAAAADAAKQRAAALETDRATAAALVKRAAELNAEAEAAKRALEQAAQDDAQALVRLQGRVDEAARSARDAAEAARAQSVRNDEEAKAVEVDLAGAQQLREQADRARQDELAAVRQEAAALAKQAVQAKLEAEQLDLELQKQRDEQRLRTERLQTLTDEDAAQDLADAKTAQAAADALKLKQGEAAAEAARLKEAKERESAAETEYRSDPEGVADAALEELDKQCKAAEAIHLQAQKDLLAAAKTPGEGAAQKLAAEKKALYEQARKRFDAATKDAGKVAATLAADAAARDGVRAKALERARAEVRSRIAAAVASAPDATADEIKAAAKAKARLEHAEAEVQLAEVARVVAEAKAALLKAKDAEAKAVAATTGKALTASQDQFLVNIKQRSVAAQSAVDELEKAGGDLELATQALAAQKLALAAAEKL